MSPELFADVFNTYKKTFTFATFLNDFLQTELKFGYENSPDMLSSLLELVKLVPPKNQLFILKAICTTSSVPISVIKLVQERILAFDDAIDDLKFHQFSTLLKIIMEKDFFNSDLEVKLKQSSLVFLDRIEEDLRRHNTELKVFLLTELLESINCCFYKDPEVRNRICEVAHKAFKRRQNELRAQGWRKMNLVASVKSSKRLMGYFKVFGGLTPENKNRVEEMAEILQEMERVLEEAANQNLKAYRLVSYTNLQNKTKEILQEIGLEYEEEKYIEGFSVDFYLKEFNAVIEVTGPIHYVGKTNALNLKAQLKMDTIEKAGYLACCIKNEDLVADMGMKVEMLKRKLEID